MMMDYELIGIEPLKLEIDTVGDGFGGLCWIRADLVKIPDGLGILFTMLGKELQVEVGKMLYPINVNCGYIIGIEMVLSGNNTKIHFNVSGTIAINQLLNNCKSIIEQGNG